MNNAFFIVGNFGVGKSTSIEYPVIETDDIFLKINENLFVVGIHIRGADSLCIYKKEDVMKKILQNKDKNLIIVGNYYCQIKDFLLLKNHFNLHLIYLNTTFEKNAHRIAKRGKEININTFNEKLKRHISLIRNVKNIAKIHIIDNNRSIEEVKPEILKILKDEKS